MRLPAVEKQGRRYDDPLLCQRMRIRRYRAGTDTADLGVVSAARHVAEKALTRVNRGRQSHVREVGPAEGRVVGHNHISRSQLTVGDQLPNAETHGAEVDRDVGSVDHQPPLGIEEGTGESPHAL